MAGFSDGVSTVWIVRAGKGLEVDGYETDLCAIEALIRRVLARGGPETKSFVMASVDAAMGHLDETDGPRAKGSSHADHEDHHERQDREQGNSG
jgi:hypothetical protein